MSVVKTKKLNNLSGVAYNNVIQVKHTLYTQTYFSMNGGIREPIPGFYVDITPRYRDSKMLIIASLAIGWETTPEWSWWVERTVGAGDGNLWSSTQVGTSAFVGSRMNGYHGGPRDNSGGTTGATDFTREVESYSHFVTDTPNTTQPCRYQICLMDKWSTRDKWINRSSEDSNNGYVTRGSSSITVMEIAQ